MYNILKQLDFYFRVIVLLIALTFGIMFIFLNGRMAMAASLRPAVTLTENVLTLGDVFDGLSAEQASYVLGPAPLPGNDMVLNARTLLRIAVAMELPWRPQHSMEQITISRAATVIDKTEISNVLQKKILEQGISDKFEIDFKTVVTSIVLPPETELNVEVAEFNFDPRNDFFTATLVAPSKDNPLQSIDLAGKIERLVAVPVLAKALKAGDVIGAYDVEWIDIYADKIQAGTVLDADQMVGMTPRRMVLPGKPVVDKELQYPQVISRGETVTIVYEDGPILLTAQGRALENGAKGDAIRVVNNSSNRSIDAFVSDDGEVTVRTN